MSDRKSAKEILKARARALARVDVQQTPGQTLEVIEFRLAKERYAIEHQFVREVVAFRELVPVPCTRAFMPGIMNLRGQILPLLDIKKFFDLPEVGITDLHSVIVVHAEGVELGILADSISSVVAIPTDGIQSSLPTLTGIRADYLKGVADQHLVILDVRRILGDPKIIVDEEVSV